MIYNVNPTQAPTPAPDFRSKPRKTGLLSQYDGADDVTLSALREETGLLMSEAQLRLFLTHLKKENTPPHAEIIYLLDCLCELFTTRPDTQALIGYDTGDPDRANALAALVSRARDTTVDEVTPPLQLRTVLDALHGSLTASLPAAPYDEDVSLYWQLNNATEAAALRAQGWSLTAQMDVADSAWQLVCREPNRRTTARRVLRGDRLMLLHGAAEQPTAAEAATAEALFGAIGETAGLRCILPVAPQMLLPTALHALAGMTIDTTTLPRIDPQRPALPCEMVSSTPGGWLVIVSADTLPQIEARCRAYGLPFFTFATARQDRKVEFTLPSEMTSITLNASLLKKAELALAYRLLEKSLPADAATAPVLPTALLLRRNTTAAGGRLSDARGCGPWCIRTVSIPLSHEQPIVPLSQALQLLRDALTEDGCTDLSFAALLCGFELREDLPRDLLWRTVLDLHHTLSREAVRLLPVALQHSAHHPSQLTLTLICHKPQPDAKEGSTEATPPHDELPRKLLLPLPDVCSLVHVAQPAALLACTPSAGNADALASTLQQAGAAVSMLVLGHDDADATALADAILASQLVLFVGDDPHLLSLLSHRRVSYALEQLVVRDGLCLIHGEALYTFCRAGLLGDMLLAGLPATPIDASAGAFPYALGYVRDLMHTEEEDALRPLPHCLPALGDEVPVGDDIIEAFMDPDPQNRQILAVTACEQGTAAVRVVACEGHRIAFADGFTPAQLHTAVRYFL